MNFLKLELEEELCSIGNGSWGTEPLFYIGEFSDDRLLVG